MLWEKSMMCQIQRCVPRLCCIIYALEYIDMSSARVSQVCLGVAWITRIHTDNKTIASHTDPGCLWTTARILVFPITIRLPMRSSPFTNGWYTFLEERKPWLATVRTLRLGIHGCISRVVVNAAWSIILRITDEVRQDSKDRIVLPVGSNGSWKLEIWVRSWHQLENRQHQWQKEISWGCHKYSVALFSRLKLSFRLFASKETILEKKVARMSDKKPKGLQDDGHYLRVWTCSKV